MRMKKKLLALLAVAALVTACGGHGSDDPVPVTDGQQTTNPDSPPADNTGGNSDPGGPSTPPDDGGGSTPPGTPDGGSTPKDQQLSGHLKMVANQLVYIKADRKIYNAINLEEFESDNGMLDFASGSATVDSSAAVPVLFAAHVAPIAAFGFRVDNYVQSDTAAGPQLGSQTAVGRVAFSLTERADTVGTNEVAEIMQFVIDGVELSTDANGKLSARVLDGAQMYVHGRNAAGHEVDETIPVPAGAVRLLPMSYVLDHSGDETSTVLLMDLEAAFSQAGDKLAALKCIKGHFAMQVTMSPVRIVRPANVTATPPLEQKELIGQAITVSDQPAVSGAGISGNAWVRMYPPQQ